MTSPRYISQISFGNVITLSLLLITAAIAWGNKESDMHSLKQTDDKTNVKVSEIAARVRVLESSHSAILAQLNYIKEAIDKKLP